MKKIKVFMTLVIFIISLLLFFGCRAVVPNETLDKVESTELVNSTKETLKFRITWKAYSGRGVAIKKIVDSYNSRNNSAYEIILVDGDEDQVAISSLLQVPDDIDIYMMPYRLVQYFGYDDALLDLTPFFSDEEEDFYPELWKLSMVNNNVYGIPWLGHSMGLIYNKSLLDKAAIDPDSITDLNKLVEACKKVEASTKAKGIGLIGAEHNDLSWMVNQFIYGFGGTLVDETGTKVTINSKNSKDAIEFYRDTLGAHAQPTWKEDTGVEVMDAFRKQEIAFEIQGLWGITDIWKNGNEFETGIIPLEQIGLYPEVGPMMLTLPKNQSEDKTKALIDFIQYLISEKAQEMIMDGEYSPEKDTYYPFRLPVRKDIVESTVFQEYPEFIAYIEGFSHPSVDVPTPLWQTIKVQFYTIGLHQVMQNQKEISDLLLQIEIEGNIILKEQKEKEEEKNE